MTRRPKHDLTKPIALTNPSLGPILWAMVERIAKAEYDRGEIKAGEHSGEVTIIGRIDGVPVEGAFKGTIRVAENGTYHPSIKAPAEGLLSLLWSQIPKAKRAKMLEELPAKFLAADGQLPEANPERLAEVKRLIKQLTIRGPAKAKAGSITASLV